MNLHQGITKQFKIKKYYRKKKEKLQRNVGLNLIENVFTEKHEVKQQISMMNDNN